MPKSPAAMTAEEPKATIADPATPTDVRTECHRILEAARNAAQGMGMGAPGPGQSTMEILRKQLEENHGGAQH
jgi:hypothetical protein